MLFEQFSIYIREGIEAFVDVAEALFFRCVKYLEELCKVSGKVASIFFHALQDFGVLFEQGHTILQHRAYLDDRPLSGNRNARDNGPRWAAADWPLLPFAKSGFPLMREAGADGDPLFELFGQTETVFQWHGDKFALPKGSVRLASSPLSQEQAFRYRDNAYGLQFHLEVTEAMIRAWMQTPMNKTELASLRGIVDPLSIRRQSPQHVGRLQELSRHVASTFCRLVNPKPETRNSKQSVSHACRR